MHTWTDAVANVHGRIKGQNATAPALIIGSHYDTVKDAGKFDGALGILVGIAAVKALVIQVALLSNSSFTWCVLMLAAVQLTCTVCVITAASTV